MNILILGVSGMLGSTVYRLFSRDSSHVVWGTERGELAQRSIRDVDTGRIISGVDISDWSRLVACIDNIRPDVIVNCIGVVKQLAGAQDPLVVVPINTLLPHRLHRLCTERDCRLIHISTDCVFLGNRGGYSEADVPDARDLYGLSKYMGEVSKPNAITLRTSIIGHELASSHSLVCWFLSQEDRVQGYARAVFSGLPTIELARVIKDVVLPRPNLHGLYHVSAEAINKYDLLQLIATQYKKAIDIDRNEDFVIDRSLDSSQFRSQTGYIAPAWPELIARMYQFEINGEINV